MVGALIATSLCRWLPTGRLAKSASWILFWQVIRVATQALWLVLIARALGPQGYGAFSGIAGLANAVGGFAGLGLGLVMYQEGVRQLSGFSKHWCQTLVVTAASGALFAVAFVIYGESLVSYEDTAAIAGVGVSELVFFPLVTAAAFAFAAHERMGWSAALPAILSCFRVAAVVAFYYLADKRTLGAYVWFHASATALCAGLAVVLVYVMLQPASTRFVLSWRDLREGLGFSSVWVSGNALSSLDKALVLRLAGSEVAGLYASAYRFAIILALPMDSLVMAAMPRLFREGGGAASNPRLVPRLLLVTLGYGLLAGGSLWLLADLMPLLLGGSFASATYAVRCMGLFLPCYGLRVLGGNLLMARGRKTHRVLIECGGLATLVMFGTWLIPHLGLYGAVMMIIATELTLSITIWGILLLGPLGRSWLDSIRSLTA
jgi:O-antigen/teichoic acid export membrane protein